MKGLFLDFETTGLDPNINEITEAAYVLYDFDSKKIVKIWSSFVKHINDAPEEISDLTGIKKKDCDEYGVSKEFAAAIFTSMEEIADYNIAHNAPFDRSFIEAALGEVTKKPWLDTYLDVPYPQKIVSLTRKKLELLAPSHGFLNPFAHRALFDVTTMIRIVEDYDINEIIERSKSPNMTIRAKVSFQDKDKAKNEGFRWNPEEKIWYLTCKEYDMPDVTLYDFDVELSYEE